MSWAIYKQHEDGAWRQWTTFFPKRHNSNWATLLQFAVEDGRLVEPERGDYIVANPEATILQRVRVSRSKTTYEEIN